VLGLVKVVGATAKGNVLHRRRPTRRIRLKMVKLEEATFGTATGCTNKRTLPAVPLPHGAADGRRNVTAA
jgi:hypothetical protein